MDLQCCGELRGQLQSSNRRGGKDKIERKVKKSLLGKFRILLYFGEKGGPERQKKVICIEELIIEIHITTRRLKAATFSQREQI
jgi:hypothetical protein